MRLMRLSVLALTVSAWAHPHCYAATTPASSAVKVAAQPPLLCPLNGKYDDQNPFARIIRGEIPVSMVYQDELVLAFLPLGWENPGETLVIPRRAVRNLYAMTDAETLAVMNLVKRIATAQQHALGATGFTIVENNGRNQTVCHAHFHVIPNTPQIPYAHVPRAELDSMAARLRAAFPARD